MGESFLDKEYGVVVWLKGSYGNVIVLFNETFTYRMNFNIFITQTKWSSWDERLKISIVNNWRCTTDSAEYRHRALKHWNDHRLEARTQSTHRARDSRELEARVETLENYGAWLKGKTSTLDLHMSFAELNSCTK